MQWQNFDSNPKNTGAQRPSVSLDDLMNELGDYLNPSNGAKPNPNAHSNQANFSNLSNFNNANSVSTNNQNFNFLDCFER